MHPARPQSLGAVLGSLKEAADAKGLELRPLDANDPVAIERQFNRFSSEPVDALIVSAILVGHRRQLAELAEGANPADMPVEQVRFAVGVNLRAAKATGVTVPQSLLLRADKVIE